MIYRALKKFSGCHYSKVLHSVAKMSSSAFESIKKVDIDPEGTFKYILIKVYASKSETDPTKMIVRGYKRCAYHSDIYDKVTTNELIPNKLEAECLGGGRIQHDPQEKKIMVYGYSQGFGKADHTVSVRLLQEVYPNYSITCSDEGY